MKIYLAAIYHRHGMNLYAGKTTEELDAKLAEFCRSNSHEMGQSAELETMTDTDAIEAYFEDDSVMNTAQEYLTRDEDEISAA